MRVAIKKCLVVALAVSAFSGINAQSWKAEAIENIHSGNFKEAETILANVVGVEREKYSVVIDSLTQIMERIRADFNMTPEQGRAAISKKVLNLSDELLSEWKSKKYLETMIIDGQEMWFRKAVRNLWLLDRDNFASENEAERKREYNELYNYYIDVMASAPDEGNVRNWHKAKITFTMDVDADAVPAGETVRVWLPYPFDNGRQRNIKFISSSHKAKFSGKKSGHHTVYMEAQAMGDKSVHFEVTYEYEVGAEIYDYEGIMQAFKPYDTGSGLYNEYTRGIFPHIVVNDHIKSIADSLTNGCDNPVDKASVIYDWIVANFPWAGARNYSTIPCMPEYVLEQEHGDCGQVALLYISMLRSVGIPARWESGWMLHPGREGMHDWCEVYYEGVGWVPCDVSMGRTVKGEDLKDYYKFGTDVYRLATNECTNGILNPEKKYLRTETVDFQEGEVEWRNGNIPHSKWTSRLVVDEFKKVRN